MDEENLDDTAADLELSGKIEPEPEPVAPTEEVTAPAIIEEKPPLSDAEVIQSIKGDSSFSDWAIDNSLAFLDLADLERVKTAEALRGQKEPQIRDKIQIANSVLVLLANYGSKNDNEALVKACEVYAEKMKTIIKRLCL